MGQLQSVYNPDSVMNAVIRKNEKYCSCEVRSSSREMLLSYIDMDMDGLQDAVARLIAGESIEVDTYLFNNDMETFFDKNDVLTLLVHLGYLSISFDNEEEDWE